MKHYYLVTYRSGLNNGIYRKIVYTSRYILIRWFDKTGIDTLLSFCKISKKEAKYILSQYDCINEVRL